MTVTAKTEVHNPLWEHQEQALAFLDRHPAACLYIEMGGGKTRIAIEHIYRHQYKRVLIVCPLSVAEVWRLELARWLGDKQPTLCDLSRGTNANRAKLLRSLTVSQDRVIAIVNYDSFWRAPLADAILAANFDCVIYDESHRLKAPGGRASRFAAQLRTRIPRRIALTGTLMPHSPLDVYAQFRALDTVLGKSFAAFRSKYAILDPRIPGRVLAYRNLDDLSRKIDLITFHSPAVGRPPEQDLYRYCLLEFGARALYDQVSEELYAIVSSEGVESAITAPHVLVRLLRLHQIAAGIVRSDDGRSLRVSAAKMNALAEIVDDLPLNEPIVVFCRFLSDLDSVREVGKGRGGALELSGRCNQLAEWQAGKGRILAVQYRAGSLGISLTRARYVVFFTLGYSLGDYLQARARIARPGQERTCVFVHLIAHNTIDVDIMEAVRRREDIVKYVTNSIRIRAREIDNSNLTPLLQDV